MLIRYINARGLKHTCRVVAVSLISLPRAVLACSTALQHSKNCSTKNKGKIPHGVFPPTSKAEGKERGCPCGGGMHPLPPLAIRGGHSMKAIYVAVTVAVSLAAAIQPAASKGCIKGAI